MAYFKNGALTIPVFNDFPNPIIGNLTSGSNIVTGVNNLSYITASLTASRANIPPDTSIVSFNTSSNTITLSKNATSTSVSSSINLQTSPGTYLVESASFTNVNGNVFVSDVTSSDQLGGSGSYWIVTSAATDPNTSLIQNGVYILYKVSKILYADDSASEISFYAAWDTEGTQAESGFSPTNAITNPFGSSSPEHNFTSLQDDLGGSYQFQAGTVPGAYNADTLSITDNFLQTHVYYTGSTVTTQLIGVNYTGSGVRVYQSGSNPNDIFVEIPGGGSGAGFPFTGSAQITGSLGVTGSVNFSTLPLQDIVTIVTYNTASGQLGYVNVTSGTSGFAGTNGISGISGTSGTSGISGTSGTAGASGNSQVSGTSGTSGTTGTAGTVGDGGTSQLSGTSGTSGTTGTVGTTGASGISQSSGTSGESGSSGTSGTIGASGNSQASGTSGTSGTTGSAGTAGDSGVSSNSGTSGTSGTTGTAGTIGASGASTLSGTSGTSGTNGTTGNKWHFGCKWFFRNFR